MQRRTLLRHLAVLPLVQPLGSLPLARAAGIKPVAPGIYRLSGDVRLNGHPARQGMPVRPGDTLVTAPGSEVIYVVGQDAYLQRGGSTVTLVGDTAMTGLRLLSGKLLSVFGRGDKRIETSIATIGIRGTGCYLEAEAARVYFCLCYGTADIASRTAPGQIETIHTRHHDMPLYLHDNGIHMMVPATVQNHSDDELILLEGLVGRVPPFFGPFSGYQY